MQRHGDQSEPGGEEVEFPGEGLDGCRGPEEQWQVSSRVACERRQWRQRPDM